MKAKGRERRNLREEENPDWKNFWSKNRHKRLMFVYWAVLMLIIVLAMIMGDRLFNAAEAQSISKIGLVLI
ncbi:MAG: hypothetical protein V1911_03110 [Candidatus Micrarchaeota archaeon]